MVHLSRFARRTGAASATHERWRGTDKADEFCVRVEVFPGYKTKRLGQCCPRAIDPAFDGADDCNGNLRRLCVRETLGANEQQNFFLVVTQNAKGFLEINASPRFLLCEKPRVIAFNLCPAALLRGRNR